MSNKKKWAKIEKLRTRRDELWERFKAVPKKDSFSGLQLAQDLDRVQQKLDQLEGLRPSVRYRPDIHIEVGG